MHKIYQLPVILLLIIALLLPALSTESEALAQTGATGITMSVAAAFNGNFKNGEWLPLYVTLENSGGDIEAEVRARVVSGSGTASYSVPVPLPTGARKRVPLYILPNNFSRQIEVELVSDNKVLEKSTVDVSPNSNITYVVGIVAPQRGSMALISGVRLGNRTIKMVDVLPGDLPERPEALRSFDLLVINDTDTSNFSQEQRTALESWVRQGGLLVIGGGAGGEKTIAGLPQELLPVLVDQAQEIISLPDLAEFGGEEIRVPGPFLAAGGETQEGRNLVEANGLPLVRERTLGSGQTIFVALDLNASPFDAWGGTSAFWEKLIRPGSAYPAWLPPDMSSRQMAADQINYALSNLPALDLPSVRNLALLLGLYVVLVGPVNYIVLRRFKRLHLAWVTIPALTVIFSAATFAMSFLLRGNDLILNKISLINLQADGSARASSYLGLFSPAQRAYEVRVSGGGLLSSMNASYDPWGGGMSASPAEMKFLQGDPGMVSGLSVNQWSMQTFQVESQVEDFGRLVSDFTVDKQGLHGTLTNETGENLKDVAVIVGPRFAKLGDVRAGETVAVELPLPEDTNIFYGGDLGWQLFQDSFNTSPAVTRDLDVKRTMINAVMQAGLLSESSLSSQLVPNSAYQPMILAWMDDAPPQASIEGQSMQQQTRALVYTAVSYQPADDGEIWLPVGLVPGGLVQTPLEGGTCSSNSSSVWLGRGDAIFFYQIPGIVEDMQIDALRLAVRSDGGWPQPPATALFDVEAGQWVTLEGMVSGINLVEDAGRFIDPTGLVQVRLSSEANNSGGCLFVDLGLQGSRQ